MDRIANDEQAMCAYLFDRLAAVPELTRYRLWPDEQPRIALATFNLDGWDHGLLGAVLSAEYGIAVRDGCFCAHPLMLDLLDVPAARARALRDQINCGDDPDLPGAVRISAGLPTTRADIDAACAALAELATRGPRLEYLPAGHGRYVPAVDDRPVPALRALGAIRP
jgi:selenocysteine lyase/cysteine desulfurase